MKFTLGQAATETGKPKSTISRAIKSGRISATKTGNKYEIDASELFRVFPATVAQPQKWNDTQPPQQTTATDVENKLLREMLERERDTISDLRERLTRAELQLTDQRPKRRNWWPF
ncbi:MAG: excisionase family DNA-binding protein [Sulfitobacter sp.]